MTAPAFPAFSVRFQHSLRLNLDEPQPRPGSRGGAEFAEIDPDSACEFFHQGNRPGRKLLRLHLRVMRSVLWRLCARIFPTFKDRSELHISLPRSAPRAHSPIMRVVFDTSVLVAAMRSTQGASYALVSLIPTSQFQL